MKVYRVDDVNDEDDEDDDEEEDDDGNDDGNNNDADDDEDDNDRKDHDDDDSGVLAPSGSNWCPGFLLVLCGIKHIITNTILPSSSSPWQFS